MYEAEDDPYCYPGTSILRNKLGLRDQAALGRFESLITTQRADEPLWLGELTVEAYCSIHRHVFGDVYDWAGQFRTVRIAKGGNMFCYPEHIGREIERVFGSLADARELTGHKRRAFAENAARFLSDLNAIHPFREGNGRAQTILLSVLATRAGHPLHLERLHPEAMLAAMIAGFTGDEEPLAGLILGLSEPP